MDLHLNKPLRKNVVSGHPWLYARNFSALPEAPVGSTVRVLDKDGFVCWGVYEPQHTIAVRVWSLREDDPPGIASLRLRLETAVRLREKIVPKGVEGYRLLNGEGDACPGWAIDRYKDVLVVRSHGEAAVARLPELVEALAGLPGLQPLRSLVHRRSRGDEGVAYDILAGESPTPFVCREYDWKMEVDVLEGQKTGWFVDQRENRRTIHEHSRGLKVANIFCYAGGFSLAAALGGASHVTSVDISKPAIASAIRNFSLNGLSESDHEFVAADAFRWMDDAVASQRKFDLLIIDPPSFAPNRRSIHNAGRAYGKLYTAAANLLEPGGLLAASSCSSHVDLEMFRDMVVQALLRQGRRIRFLMERGAGPDHPILPAFPEGRYLKFLLGVVE